MIAVPAGMRVLVATRPIDFRKGADGLVALVSETLRDDPFSGTVFVFRSKRAQPTSFSIPFSFCDDRLSLASIVRTDVAGFAVSPRQGTEVHLHERAA
jgi:transposase